MCLLAQLCPTLYDPMDCSPPGSSVHGDSPGQEYWSGLPCHPPGDLPKPGMEPRSPELQADSILSEPPGKPKNTGVGSHSLLQGIFPTQGSNPGLLNCRRILYQLSHKESPRFLGWSTATHLTYSVMKQYYSIETVVGHSIHLGHYFKGKNFPTDQVSQS